MYECLRRNRHFPKFTKEFDKVYKLLDTWVSRFNYKLEPENLKLEIVTGAENETSNRKALQVVLNEDKKPTNLLENPYLLIEGYANNGNIRIVPGGSSDQGNIMNVNTINSDIVENEISNFLVKAVY